MWITKTSINNPVFATMVMIAIMVLGLFSYQRLGIEAMPNVEIPVASVIVNYPGASPEQVENDLTKPIEDVVNTIAGVKKIRSNSWEGRSGIFIEFSLATNMDKAVQELRDKIAAVRVSFPKDAKEAQIRRADGENNSFMGNISLTSDTRDLRELSNLSEQLIVKRLQNVAGVGEVRANGMTTRQVSINLRPEQLSALGVGVDEVMRAVSIYNQNMPAGNLSDGSREQLVRIEGRIKDVRSFGKIIVARRATGPILLEQVATIIDGEREESSISRLNGKPAINFDIGKVQDANITEVGRGVEKAVKDMAKELPADVKLNIMALRSEGIQKQVDNVKKMIIEGGVLTMVIVFLFLGSWRSTIITGLTLPISVIATFIALKVFNFTINTLTLMAMSLCIGLLIDDAIVVRENIMRHLGMGKNHKQASNDGTNEIGLAVMATTFAIVAVFIPVAFMDGIIGRFFLQFGVTVAVAVLISLFVSFTLDPMLSSVWPDPIEGRFKYVPGLAKLMDGVEYCIEALHRWYNTALQWALNWRKTTLLLALLIFIGSLALVPKIGGEMFPEVDEGEISLSFKTPVGSSLDYTNAKIFQVEDSLRQFKEIQFITTTVGDEGRNTARIDLKLHDRVKTPRRSQKDLEKAIREKLAPIAGVDMSVGHDKPIFIAILGQDESKLDAVAQKLMTKIRAIKGVVDLEYSLAAANPATVIKINNEAASDLGLSPQQIGNALRPLVAGDTITRWLAPDGQNYDVTVQLPKANRQKVSDLEQLSIASGKVDADGKPIMVPLRQVVQFIPSTSPQVIKRQALQRRVAIYANIEGRPSGDVNGEIDKIIASMEKELPAGVRFDIGGQAEEQKSMMGSAITALGIAVIFIYLVLASQFGSFLQPIAIMVSLPLSLIGVLLALLITGSTLNMFSIIGFIMLMGLVTKNAILLVDFANQAQREDGLDQFKALLAAGNVRLRPILMTTLAMVFGMLPMAIGAGEGGEIQAPMGRAVIGGVITSTLLTLVVVPVAYTYLNTFGNWATRKFKGKHYHLHMEAAANAHKPATSSNTVA